MFSRKAVDIGNVIEDIYPATMASAVNPLVYTNVSDIDDGEFQSWLFSYNVPRQVSHESVSLLRYPSGTTVDGDGSYIVHSGGFLVSEQLPPWVTPSRELIRDVSGRRVAGFSSVREPCLLVARYGETTWGHWLYEMLPKIAIAEALFPRRFRYVVPSKIFVRSQVVAAEYVQAVVGSVQAYGVDLDRLLALPAGTAVAFDALHDITGTHTGGMHPDIMGLMQSEVRRSPARHLPRRAALLRRPSDFRTVSNLEELKDFAAHRGFSIIDIASFPFEMQVTLFEGADTLIAGLGSGLAGSIFMKKQVDVLTVAPGRWYDNYFAIVLAQKAAYLADIRGVSNRSSQGEIQRSNFHIELARLSEALDILSSRDKMPAQPGAVLLDGRIQPRKVGEKIYEIRFGRNGNSRPYQRDGWCEAEEDRTWTFGKTSSLEFPRKFPDGDYWLEIIGSVFVHQPNHNTKRFRPTINSAPLAERQVAEHCNLFWFVPGEVFRQSRITIRFDHPECPSPQSLSASSDPRPLGFSFVRLAFYRMAID